MNKEELLDIYRGIEESKEYKKELIRQNEKVDKEIENRILMYRIASVSRVLDFIHTSLAINSSIDLDTLITHCCNKLNGNIDGIEIEL